MVLNNSILPLLHTENICLEAIDTGYTKPNEKAKALKKYQVLTTTAQGRQD